MKILVISWRMPWDTACSGGQKTHNFYLKKLAELYGDDVLLLSFIEDYNLKKCDLDKYNINHRLIVIKKDYLHRGVRYLYNMDSNLNIHNVYGGIAPGWYLHKATLAACKIKKEGFIPDIIILEWTQMLFLEKKLKKIFPLAKIVASEHDVSYLSYYRKIENASTKREKKKAIVRYDNLRKSELGVLQAVDLIFTHNTKDRDLLIADGIASDKLDWIVPFYSDPDEKYQYKPQNRDIVFFGAMGRPENYLSAIWFIKNVMPKLSNEDVRFVIVGSYPAPELKKYAGEKVEITGFVEDVYDYFRNALCYVSPLVLGGGIKIKVLEGLAYGVPVLTNCLGIEGIPAKDRVNYIHCEKADEYVKAINDILSGKIILDDLSREEIKLIKDNFDKKGSFENYHRRLFQLMKK